MRDAITGVPRAKASTITSGKPSNHSEQTTCSSARPMISSTSARGRMPRNSTGSPSAAAIARISAIIGPSPTILSGTSRSERQAVQQRAHALLLGEARREHRIATATGARRLRASRRSLA